MRSLKLVVLPVAMGFILTVRAAFAERRRICGLGEWSFDGGTGAPDGIVGVDLYWRSWVLEQVLTWHG